jgi:hypothetical protein
MDKNRRDILLISGVTTVAGLSGCLRTSTPTENGDNGDGGDGANGGGLFGGNVANPWGTSPITVKTTNETKSPRNFNRMVSSAIRYWNKNISEVGFEGEFKITSDDQAHMEVKIVESIDSCGTESNSEAVGCAPYYSSKGDAEGERTTVKIESGYQDDATEKIIRHEIGHTLGLKHEDASKWPVMKAKTTVPKVTQPTVYEKDNPWETQTISVYYDLQNIQASKKDKAVSEFNRAIEYYNTESSLLPNDVTVKREQNPNKSQIIITFDSKIDGVSVADWSGYDSDGDKTLESYTEATIAINPNADPNTYGWHVGFWMGQTFGIRSPDGLPDPFNSPESADRVDW